MILVVGERHGANDWTAMASMADLGRILVAASGRNGLREMVVRATDAGGCSVNLGNGLASLGVQVHHFGTTGSPRHPAVVAKVLGLDPPSDDLAATASALRTHIGVSEVVLHNRSGNAVAWEGGALAVPARPHCATPVKSTGAGQCGLWSRLGVGPGRSATSRPWLCGCWCVPASGPQCFTGEITEFSRRLGSGYGLSAAWTDDRR